MERMPRERMERRELFRYRTRGYLIVGVGVQLDEVLRRMFTRSVVANQEVTTAEVSAKMI